MKIVFYAYRDWAIDIFKSIKPYEKYLVSHNDYECLKTLNPDLIFFIGWSEIVPNEIINNYKCICLHPSKLPKYRGGSPIQHQIINGETESAVSLFIMDEGIDTGDILIQRNFSLLGTLDEIFDRIVNEGIISINKILDDFKLGELKSYKQDNSQSTYFKRRKPEESEITAEELLNNTPLYIYNKVRSLDDPYPNAFLRCKDGERIYIKQVKL